MRTLLTIVALCLVRCAPAPPPEPAPAPQPMPFFMIDESPAPQPMSFFMVDEPDVPCRNTCGFATCILGYDQESLNLVNCENGFADTCACVGK